MNTTNAQNISNDLEYITILKKDYIYGLSKRAIDVLVSLTALFVLAPFLMIICLIVRLTSKGKAIYWQERVGLNGKVIQFPKIRSMIQNADHLIKNLSKDNDHKEGLTFKMKDDPRVTTIGRFIRKFSIDELPQLWLVLTGDLSLVGPRPALVPEVQKYTSRDRQRLLVKPGLTCIWQVSGRGDVAFKEQVLMDLEYIKQRSFCTDLKLLILTVPAVITGRGAY